MKINEFLSRNEQNEPKMSKNRSFLTKNKQKSAKNEVIKALLIIGILIAFGADMYRFIMMTIDFFIEGVNFVFNSV